MKRFSLLVFVLFIWECHSNTTVTFENIHIKKNIIEAISIDEIFDEYMFVGLEATDSSLIGEPGKIVLKDGIIYVLDRGRLVQFTINGSYLRTLDRRGRGPQEYLGIDDFVIENEEIIIWDRNSKTLLRYSLDNEFINRFVLNDFASTIYLIEKDRIMFSSAYQSKDEYKFVIRDMNTMSLVANFFPISKEQKSYRHFVGQDNYFVSVVMR